MQDGTTGEAAVVQQLRGSWYSKVKAWLRRAQQAKAKDWRPKAKKRVKALHFILAFDNQLAEDGAGLAWLEDVLH